MMRKGIMLFLCNLLLVGCGRHEPATFDDAVRGVISKEQWSSSSAEQKFRQCVVYWVVRMRERTKRAEAPTELLTVYYPEWEASLGRCSEKYPVVDIEFASSLKELAKTRTVGALAGAGAGYLEERASKWDGRVKTTADWRTQTDGDLAEVEKQMKGFTAGPKGAHN